MKNPNLPWYKRIKYAILSFRLMGLYAELCILKRLRLWLTLSRTEREASYHE